MVGSDRLRTVPRIPGRDAATISGEKAHRSVVRIHRDSLPTRIVDDLLHHPEGHESVENVLADVVAFAGNSTPV